MNTDSSTTSLTNNNYLYPRICEVKYLKYGDKGQAIKKQNFDACDSNVYLSTLQKNGIFNLTNSIKEVDLDPELYESLTDDYLNFANINNIENSKQRETPPIETIWRYPLRRNNQEHPPAVNLNKNEHDLNSDQRRCTQSCGVCERYSKLSAAVHRTQAFSQNGIYDRSKTLVNLFEQRMEMLNSKNNSRTTNINRSLSSLFELTNKGHPKALTGSNKDILILMAESGQLPNSQPANPNFRDPNFISKKQKNKNRHEAEQLYLEYINLLNNPNMTPRVLDKIMKHEKPRIIPIQESSRNKLFNSHDNSLKKKVTKLINSQLTSPKESSNKSDSFKNRNQWTSTITEHSTPRNIQPNVSNNNTNKYESNFDTLKSSNQKSPTKEENKSKRADNDVNNNYFSDIVEYSDIAEIEKSLSSFDSDDNYEIRVLTGSHDRISPANSHRSKQNSTDSNVDKQTGQNPKKDKKNKNENENESIEQNTKIEPKNESSPTVDDKKSQQDSKKKSKRSNTKSNKNKLRPNQESQKKNDSRIITIDEEFESSSAVQNNTEPIVSKESEELNTRNINKKEKAKVRKINLSQFRIKMKEVVRDDPVDDENEIENILPDSNNNNDDNKEASDDYVGSDSYQIKSENYYNGESIIGESTQSADDKSSKIKPDLKSKKGLMNGQIKRPNFKPEKEEIIVEQEDMSTRFIDDWLLKWCILRENNVKMCEKVFNKYDPKKRGHINGEKLMSAISSITNLDNLKLNYLFSVLNLCETNPFKTGADLKLFSLITALANRIQHLDDDWFYNMLPQLDLSTVENKVFKIKNLWNFLVDNSTKTININELMIEFEAGGVTQEHLEFAREKFSNKFCFDLLDYLCYIPLFVYIHDRIVKNPLEKNSDI